MIDVLMPRLSDTMTEGTIAAWRKQPGEHVTAGEVLVEIETDKALMEQEAYEDGVLSEILVAVGELAVIGTPIARIDDGRAPEPTANNDSAERTANSSSEAANETESLVALDHGEILTPRETNKGQNHREFVASPLVRKLARERGIDLAAIRGSGPGGRIVRADITEGFGSDAAIARPQTAALDQSLTGSEVATSDNLASGEPSEFAESTTVPFDAVRRAIATRLSASTSTIPSFTVTSSADVTKLLELRGSLNSALSSGGTKISVNDLVVRAVAHALRAYPGVNASYSAAGAGATVLHHGVHIGVAMASSAGLVVPVIRRADTLSISALSRAAAALGKRAQDRTLSPADMQGGTFTVSNLGMYGVDQFDAIINPPQGAILAVGAAREELALRDGIPVARKRMSVTLTSDHRIIDGALAAQFLQELTRLLEAPLEILA